MIRFVCYFMILPILLLLCPSFRKSTSATLSYYKHKRFSLRHTPKTVPTTTSTTTTATAGPTATIRASATRASLSAASSRAADTIPLTENDNLNDTGELASAIYNNTAFVDNETCR